MVLAILLLWIAFSALAISVLAWLEPRRSQRADPRRPASLPSRSAVVVRLDLEAGPGCGSTEPDDRAADELGVSSEALPPGAEDRRIPPSAALWI